MTQRTAGSVHLHAGGGIRAIDVDTSRDLYQILLDRVRVGDARRRPAHRDRRGGPRRPQGRLGGRGIAYAAASTVRSRADLRTDIRLTPYRAGTSF